MFHKSEQKYFNFFLFRNPLLVLTYRQFEINVAKKTLFNACYINKYNYI